MSDIRMTLRYCVNVFLVSLAVLLSEMTSRSVKTASKLARIPNQTNVANDKKQKQKQKNKTKQNTYRTSAGDYSTSNSCYDPSGVKHFNIRSVANEKPSQNEWYCAQHGGKLPTKPVHRRTTDRTSKNSTNRN